VKKIILHLCADTGSDSYPYQLDDRYEVIIVGKSVGVENFKGWNGVYGVIANPVCTEFSTAQSRALVKNLDEGMVMVNHCLRIIEECNVDILAFWAIENPATGRLREFLGAPAFTYQPYQFGSAWTKNTALWGRFNPPAKTHTWNTCEKLNLPTYQGREKPSLAKLHKSHCALVPEFSMFNPQTDAEFRSLCSQKFARAFYEANQ
jgi:hypothetical protein